MSAPIADPGATIYLKDWLTIAALLLGPVVAVWWTLYHQDQKEKRTEKIRLFQTLMALRKLPPTPEWANALNLIDVVYSDHPKIVADWHAMYDILVQQQAGTERHNHAYLSLLSGMAAALGYDKLKQTDIDKFYYPSGQGELATRQTELQKEFLRVLKASKNMAEGNAEFPITRP